MAGPSAQAWACTITPVATDHSNPEALLSDLGAHPTQDHTRRTWTAFRKHSY